VPDSRNSTLLDKDAGGLSAKRQRFTTEKSARCTRRAQVFVWLADFATAAKRMTARVAARKRTIARRPSPGRPK